MTTTRTATGEQVLHEILDLVDDRLTQLEASDPVRPHLAALARELGLELGRRPVRLVGRGR